jgi:hypothetical protein
MNRYRLQSFDAASLRLLHPILLGLAHSGPIHAGSAIALPIHAQPILSRPSRSPIFIQYYSPIYLILSYLIRISLVITIPSLYVRYHKILLIVFCLRVISFILRHAYANIGKDRVVKALSQ